MSFAQYGFSADPPSSLQCGFWLIQASTLLFSSSKNVTSERPFALLGMSASESRLEEKMQSKMGCF